MEQQCRQEVLDLHRFFVDWFSGRLPQTEATFTRLTSALDEGMVLISPDGATLSRKQILGWIQQAHNTRADMSPPFHIWIENFQVRHYVGDLALVTYEEWQEVAGEINSRLSTALFKKAPGLPNQVTWLHVHETRLPG
jgi:hypothetical protein